MAADGIERFGPRQSIQKSRRGGYPAGTGLSTFSIRVFETRAAGNTRETLDFMLRGLRFRPDPPDQFQLDVSKTSNFR
jgi:RNA 3'-terminal phosphate cyclase